MNQSQMTCAEVEQSLGSFVLGALDPFERDQVEAHVRLCSGCASILTELAPLPGLLNRIDLAEADLKLAPAELLDRVLAVVEADTVRSLPRQRRRVQVGVGLAAAIAVLTAVIGVRLNSSASSPVAASIVAKGWSDTTHVAATIAMTPKGVGTELALTLTGVRPGEHCQLIAVGRNGTKEIAVAWVATYEGEAKVRGDTTLAIADISWFNVTTPDGAILLRVQVKG